MSRYGRFLSRSAQRRKPSPIRALFELASAPGMLNLSGGLPNPGLFPVSSLSVNGARVEAEELAAALQYSGSFGFPPLLREVEALHAEWHGRREQRGVCVTTGSQAALSKAFGMLLDEGDAVLVEQPTYSGALASLRGLGAGCTPVDTDEQGAVPESLARAAERSGARVFYAIPTGGNPTGASMSEERKRQLYAVCAEKDLLLLEDDPYFHLSFEAPVASFQSMDEEARVLRFDSFSKIISSGLRLGYVSGPQELITLLQLDQQATELHTSNISQAVLASILRQWGLAGFQAHVASVQAEYRRRRDLAVAAVEEHLQGLVSYSVPTAGMFLWLRVLDCDDTLGLAQKELADALVLVVPGAAFSATDAPSPYIRLSYSIASDDAIREAISRIGAALRKRKKQLT